MLKDYRDIVWALECFPERVAEELDRPLKDLDALLRAVDTQLAMNKGDKSRVVFIGDKIINAVREY